MTFIEAAILGTLQGLTEFLPVSSSGHLALAEHLIGFRPEFITFDICLHGATLIAVLVYFRNDVRALIRAAFRPGQPENKGHVRSLMLIAASTLVTVVLGVSVKPFVFASFESPIFIGIALGVTGCVLLGAHLISRKTPRVNLAGAVLWHAVAIGLAQTCALFPGISRSGMTIAAALVLGWDRADAFRYSFLLLIPVTIGATALELSDATFSTDIVGIHAIAGYLLAAIAGYAALVVLRRFVVGRLLWVFSIYLWVVSGVVVLMYGTKLFHP